MHRWHAVGRSDGFGWAVTRSHRPAHQAPGGEDGAGWKTLTLAYCWHILTSCTTLALKGLQQTGMAEKADMAKFRISIHKKDLLERCKISKGHQRMPKIQLKLKTRTSQARHNWFRIQFSIDNCLLISLISYSHYLDWLILIDIDANSSRISPKFGASNALNHPCGPLKLVARRLARLDHWKWATRPADCNQARRCEREKGDIVHHFSMRND